jgi:hypothetical protein
MPLTEEYRTFWLDGVLVFWAPYGRRPSTT